jgi:hypothetical protein
VAWAIAVGLVLLVVAIAFVGPLRSRAQELIAFGSGSGRSRLEIWRTALAVWGAHPWLGSGPDTFHLLFSRYQTHRYWLEEWAGSAFHAHSIYLNTLATRGVAGVLAAAAVVATATLLLHRGTRVAGSRPSLVPAIAALLVALAVAGGSGVLGFAGATVVVVALGTLPALHAPAAPARRRGRDAGALTPVSIAAGAFAGIAMLWPTVTELRASHAAFLSTQHDVEAPLAVAWAREAEQWTPWSDMMAANAAEVLRLRASESPDPPGAFALAESCARRAVRLAPDRLYDQNELVQVLLTRSRLGVVGAEREALEALARCEQLGPYNILTLIRFSEKASRMGRGDLALPAAQRAAAIYPTEALPQVTLGEAYLCLRDSVAARAAFERSLGLTWREGSNRDDVRRRLASF